MRKPFPILVFAILPILVFVSFGCTPSPKGHLVLQSISTGMESYGCPYFAGVIKNDGNKGVYNADITLTIYADAAKTIIIDTAWDYLANGNTIGAGQSVVFHATTFSLDAVNDLQYYNYAFTWL